MLSLGVWRAGHFIWRWSAIDGVTNCSRFAQDCLGSTTNVPDHGNLVLANWDIWPPEFEVVPHFYVAYLASLAKLKENFCYGCALLRLTLLIYSATLWMNGFSSKHYLSYPWTKDYESLHYYTMVHSLLIYEYLTSGYLSVIYSLRWMMFRSP